MSPDVDEHVHVLVSDSMTSVRQIALAHGWEVAVTESEDGGARFEVTDVDRVG